METNTYINDIYVLESALELCDFLKVSKGGYKHMVNAGLKKHPSDIRANGCAFYADEVYEFLLVHVSGKYLKILGVKTFKQFNKLARKHGEEFKNGVRNV